ncbi:hypothetical protein AMK25_22400 [Micromonospora sp. TSRI0369]|uniref:hypothetical protein n=1 Tax=Micromonospora sp. TSRI0369 TaxID=1703936 RepID=UPI00093D14A5|nr:hypothetical protein [Micromonospora sp. TSRI0369]OKJ42079.1 hypothetical protein AMK25_22400 [Micromonospora sp. TSRI0369]
MTNTAAYALALVLIGGPTVMLTPFVVACLLAAQHSQQVADDIAHQAGAPSVATSRRELIAR